MRKPLLLAPALAALLAGGATAQTDALHGSALEWREMFPGVAFAPAYGDWETGAHGKYVRIGHGTEIPLHTHSNEYRAVMISGRMANLYEGGARIDLGPGDYFYMAGNRLHAHDCVSEDPCLFYTYGDGLWDVAVPEAD